MTLSVGWSQNVARQFMDYIRGYLLVTPSLYNFFKANGLIRQLPKGQDRLTYLTVDEPAGGELTSSIHNAYVNAPNWEEVSTGMTYLVAKVILSKQDVDKHTTGHWLRGDLIQDTINLVMPKMLNQVDAILAWGDEYRHSPDGLEVFRGQNAINGIMNGGTQLQGGIDTDDDMQVAGDYLATVAQHRAALRTAGHELDQYMIMSDLQTDLFAELENQFFVNVGVTEKQRVLEKKYIRDWMSSANFIDRTGLQFRMAMLAPTQNNNPIGAKGNKNNFELFQGYPFEVHFDANGGTIDNYYVFYIIWSGRFVEYYATAIQRTGTLTLT
jgi:hypothetical protein